MPDTPRETARHSDVPSLSPEFQFPESQSAAWAGARASLAVWVEARKDMRHVRRRQAGSAPLLGGAGGSHRPLLGAGVADDLGGDLVAEADDRRQDVIEVVRGPVGQPPKRLRLLGLAQLLLDPVTLADVLDEREHEQRVAISVMGARSAHSRREDRAVKGHVHALGPAAAGLNAAGPNAAGLNAAGLD